MYLLVRLMYYCFSALILATAALPIVAYGNGPSAEIGQPQMSITANLPSCDVRDLARAQNSTNVKRLLDLLRSSNWQISAFETAPIDCYRAPLAVGSQTEEGGPETTWTRLSLHAERMDSTGKIIGRTTVFIGWEGYGEPEVTVQPDGQESRAILETDLDKASVSGSEKDDGVQPIDGLSKISESEAVTVAQSCSAEGAACSFTPCCKGYLCKYWGSSLTCGCERSSWACSYISNRGLGHPLCTTTPLWAYYKVRTIRGCQEATSLWADACGNGISCPLNPTGDLTITFCGQKPDCKQ